MLYGTPQVRELLWIRYGTILSEFDPYHSSYYSFFWLFYYKTLFSYSTLSLLLVAFCFIALNPDYRRSLLEKPTEASDPGRVSELLGYGLITSAVFLTIVVYNIIAVTFPYFPAIAINVLGLILPLNLAVGAVEFFAPHAIAKAQTPTTSPRPGRGSRIAALAGAAP